MNATTSKETPVGGCVERLVRCPVHARKNHGCPICARVRPIWDTCPECNGNGCTGRTFRDETALPEGKTCNDCYAFKFCIGIGCTSHGATHCDYWPNRFRPNVPAQRPSAKDV